MSDRFAIQPRFVYARASKSDEDLLWVASLSYDLRSRNRQVIPYLTGGAGILNHHGGYRWRSGFTFGGGLGVKIRISEDLFFAPEIQLGWEPFLQISGAGGRAF